MNVTPQTLTVARGPHRMHAEVVPGDGVPVVLMHGFPDNLHLYDRLLPYLAGRVPVVRFDFLGWGRSDKPAGYPYTATNQAGDVIAIVDAVSTHLGSDRVVLVAHDASGPPAIALYSTPVLRAAVRAVVRRRPDLDRRLYAWQVGGFIRDREVRDPYVAKLYQQFLPARPAFWRLNDDLLGTVLTRRRRISELRRFNPPIRVIFGARDRYLNARVARRFAALFPRSELYLLPDAGHYVQVDEPQRVADLVLAGWHHETHTGYGS
jgi:haloalkane dehalogenase